MPCITPKSQQAWLTQIDELLRQSYDNTEQNLLEQVNRKFGDYLEKQNLAEILATNPKLADCDHAYNITGTIRAKLIMNIIKHIDHDTEYNNFPDNIKQCTQCKAYTHKDNVTRTQLEATLELTTHTCKRCQHG